MPEGGQRVEPPPGFAASRLVAHLVDELIPLQFSEEPVQVRRIEDDAARLRFDGFEQAVAVEGTVGERQQNQVVARLEGEQRPGARVCS